MGDFLLTVGFLLLLAWVARGLVGARGHGMRIEDLVVAISIGR
ncbi:MAG TPA: hypothetical protein VHM29_03495 [Acidimicrobiia bacterium]|jgi:hypothetical protein|nr:hypothetical protein [Acidimicrobiia bacterium]